ncbi:MAG: type II toxin-antitoxin system HicB family antitoxin [Fimbriimonadales bacterium]
MTLKVIIQQGEESGFVAQVPALPGCWSQGRTLEEALTNAREAAQGWIEVQQDKMERPNAKAQVELITI